MTVPSSWRRAVAVVDVQLAERASSLGWSVTPSQVRRWRMAGLLPAPSSIGVRPPAAPIGRAPRAYEDSQLPQLDAMVAILAKHARPGRGPGPLALILFAHRMPVPPQLLLNAITEQLQRLRDRIDRETEVATRQHPPPEDPELRQSDTFEQAEALAKRVVATKNVPSGIRRNLRAAGLPVAAPDMLSTMTNLFETVLGSESPGSKDDETQEALLHAFGSHGLLEPITPGGPAVVTDGPAAVADAVRATSGLLLRPLPGDVSIAELEAARNLCADVGEALASIEDPRLRHHLGGEVVVGGWDPSDPDLIAFSLNAWTWINRLEAGPADPTPLLDALSARTR